MKKLIAFAAIVILSGAFAKAEDKGTEFKFGGELRERFNYDNNVTFLNSNGDVESHWSQREMFHINAIASDRIQAYFNLLGFNTWGATGTVPSIPSSNGAADGVPGNSNATINNAVMVHEAWLWYKASDMLSFKAGRMSADFGDGIIIAKNDWYTVPYNFDGIMARLSWDFLDLDLGGVKLADGGVTAPTTPTNISTSAPGANSDTDTEVNVYGVYASLKNLPDVLKTADLGILQMQGDTGTGLAGGGVPLSMFAPGFATGSTTGNNGGAFGLTTINLHLKGEFAMVDYRLDGAWQSGKQKGTAAWNGGQDVTFSGSMYDIEAGVNFPEFMKARVFVNYHMDSGNDQNTVGRTGGDATKNNQYQPLFWDGHRYGGGMDFWNWGNFTNIKIGATVKPDENVTYGLEFDMASRTTSNAPYVARPFQQHNMFQAPTTTNFTDSALGTEIDLFANHTYGHGLSSKLALGYLTLGNYFKNTGATSLSIGSGWQGIAQVQYNF